jgi:hypothetical protein
MNNPIFLKFYDPIIKLDRAINYKFFSFFAISLAFFNLTSSARAKFSSARIRVLLVYRPIIPKEAEVKNIRQESYIDCSMLSFSR